jgi:hypothetical protein
VSPRTAYGVLIAEGLVIVTVIVIGNSRINRHMRLILVFSPGLFQRQPSPLIMSCESVDLSIGRGGMSYLLDWRTHFIVIRVA